MTRRRVIVVGGGIAGLAAAEALARNHADRFAVTVLEAKRFTGGRAGSFLDPQTDEVVDYCQHVAMGCCTQLLGLLDRCGLEEVFERYGELTFLHPDHLPSRFAPMPLLPAPLHLASALAGLRYLDAAQRKEIRRGLLGLLRSSPANLRSHRAGNWLRQQGQSAETIRLFWDVILVSALGDPADTVSMAAARKVLVDGFAAARHASDVLIPRMPLRELFGTTLPGAIRQLGVPIRTATPVRKIVARHDGLTGVQLSSGELLPADHVICAVPWHALGRLVGEGPGAAAITDLDAIATIPASPITGIHLWFDRPITDRPHAVMVDTLAQWIFRVPSNCMPPRDQTPPSQNRLRSHHYQVVISGAHATTRSAAGDRASRAELVETVTGELRGAFPDAGEARLLQSRVVTDPLAVFSAQPCVEAIRPPAETGVAWLHLAGDWTRTGWPSTMEGAVISGQQAAASVLTSEEIGFAKTPSLEKSSSGLNRGWLARWLIKD